MRSPHRIPAARHARHITLVLACLGLLACEDALGPADVAGTYVYAPPGGLAVQMPVEGGTLPFTLLVHDTLTLRADGSGLVSGRGAWVVVPPGEAEDRVRSWSFDFTIDGSRLTTSPAPCINPYQCDGWEFRLQGDAVIRINGGSPSAAEVYRRVGPPT